MHTLPSQLVFASAASLAALTGALSDLRTRRIPNGLTAPAILAGLLLHFGLNGWRGLGSSIAAAGIAFVIFLLFFLAGGMGAGDVKLATAAAALAGLHAVGEMLILTSLAGGVLALGLAMARGRLRATLTNVMVLAVHHRVAGLEPHSQLHVRNSEALRIPYGVAIAAGCLLTLVTQIHALYA